MYLFFNISGGEIIIVFVFVLLFFGAKSIPDVARTLGRTFRQIKDATNDIQREFESSANDFKNQVKKDVKNIENAGRLDQPMDDQPTPTEKKD